MLRSTAPAILGSTSYFLIHRFLLVRHRFARANGHLWALSLGSTAVKATVIYLTAPQARGLLYRVLLERKIYATHLESRS